MNQIDISIKLRPIRFLYLISPSDLENLQNIFEINTCLWGGMYNPIVPYFRKVPNWWDREHKSFYNARKILDYHIDFFEPDFIIESKRGMSKSLNLCNDVTLQLNNILGSPSDRSSHEAYGLNVFELYKYLYQQEFKYVRRHEHNILNIKSEKKDFKAFCACVFGAFPNKKILSYIKRGFKDAFGPKEILLNAEKLSSLYSNHFASALEIGCKKLDISYSRNNDPTLFLLNASDPRDLIDYWNLRIVEKNVWAIPIQWIDHLSDFCKTFISKNHRPLPGNPHGVMISTTIQMPRSISKEEGQKIYEKYLNINKTGAAALRFWYPSFWVPPSEVVLGNSRSTLTSATKSVTSEISGSDNSIRFDTLHPDFADDYSNHYRWANVIELNNRYHDSEIATVYPHNLRDPSFPNLSIGDHMLTTTEGFVVFPTFKNIGEYWRLQDGTTALIEWFEKKNVKTEVSPPGKITLQIFKTMGSINNISAIANPRLIDLLNKMAHKQIKWTSDNNDSPPKYYQGNTVQYSEFEKLMHEINKNVSWKIFSIKRLVSSNVIKLGLEVKCKECQHWNWYSIDGVNYELKCESCLTAFEFPTSNPTNRGIRWAYRVIGPFSNPDYAGGAYSTIFSIRFFRQLLDSSESKITWSTSLNFKFQSGEKLEADFIFWYQRKRIFDRRYKPVLVFGESKSFGEHSFEDKDISRLQNIAKKFTGSVFVFTTMKKDLSDSEKKLISTFALWGREDNGFGESKAPVIVLTSIEIFAFHNISIEWKQLGGKHATLIGPAYIRPENLRVLADLTQQLYLDLPSYGAWSSKQRQKRMNKKN